MSESDAKAAIELLRSKHKISKLDIVMANAGIGTDFSFVKETPVQAMKDHFEVNVIGPLILFQATLPLLTAAPDPKFMVTSSSVGSIGDILQAPSLAYGCSKAAVNYLVRKVHVEHPNITTVALHPGFVPSQGYQISLVLIDMMQVGAD